MTISTEVWDKYIKALRKCSDAAAKKFSAFLESAGDPAVREVRDALIEYAYALATKYGEAAAELACQMYDAVAEISGVALDPAIPAATATMEEAAKAVVGTLKTGNNEIVADAVARMVKLAGVDTTIQNAVRDNAEWAWIPRGETCAFCIALASGGWQPASRAVQKGNHAEHVHANCDCTFAVRHDRRSDVEGYDPDRYYAMYRYELDDNGEVRIGEDGRPVERPRSSTARINGMRRDFYAATRAEVSRTSMSEAAKRAALNDPTAEETIV